jgi:flagellar motor switch protein FliG
MSATATTAESFASPEFAQLPRPRKLAIFLVVIGPEAAAEVLRQFEDPEVESLCREMSAIGVIPEATRQEALDEFSGVIGHGVTSVLGGPGYMQRALELAKGDFKASTILSRLNPAGPPVEIIKEIGEMDARQIFNLVRCEQPQTIAFVLSYLDSVKASEVFSLLPAGQRDDVLERLGTIESTSLGLVKKFVHLLGRRTDSRTRSAFHASGGVPAVADLINHLDKATGRALLARIDERNSQLGVAVRKKLFGFEDLARLAPADLQRVLREVDSASLATALKSASAPLREKIYGSISKRAAESLRDEISMLGAVRMKDVEIAQQNVIQAARRLEEEGEIALDGGGGDLVA